MTRFLAGLTVLLIHTGAAYAQQFPATTDQGTLGPPAPTTKATMSRGSFAANARTPARSSAASSGEIAGCARNDSACSCRIVARCFEPLRPSQQASARAMRISSPDIGRSSLGPEG